MKEKIVVAISGGVDSTVAAAICLEQGYDVYGVTLRMKQGIGGEHGCSSPEDEDSAVRAADQLGISHTFIDCTREFTAKVLLPCWNEYAAGRTPNPCTLCNPLIKFGQVIDYADRIGARRVVTGHYAVIEHDAEDGPCRLRRGADPSRDQSYFLFGLTPAMLTRLDFPLGRISKPEVRRMAAALKLENHSRKDSQDACFVIPGEPFSESLRKLFQAPALPGEFITPDGKSVGRHLGCHLYTLGQRKGLGVALGVPAYVSAIDSSRGRVVISPDESHLLSSGFTVKNLNWQQPEPGEESRKLLVQVRYRSQAVPATVQTANSIATVRLDESVRAVTPGQAAVFYDRDLLLGGGYIADTETLSTTRQE